ncbi:MAG: SulP family inorganic anion transporter [Candidatus Woesearchaeota archaeon]
MKVSTYVRQAFVFDLKAGMITAIVSLPLALAFAIASGVAPVMGLYTAIIAGFLASSFGGSRFSITGPTGAMTVIILSTISKHGLEGLLLATFLAGCILVLLGLFSLGKLVKYIPFPIVSGFTAGIGLLLLIGQLPNFLGLSIAPQEHVWDTLVAIGKQFSAIDALAIGLSLATLLILWFFPKLLSKTKLLKYIPASFIALFATTFFVHYFGFPVPLVGQIPTQLPSFNFFVISWELVKQVLPAAFTIALLGAIESLLCAVVADGMTATKHDSNKELVGQGIANIAVPFFGGIPATAAIARTAVLIREGAKTRMAGIYHAFFLLLILLFFGSYAALIPKAFLAGMLIFVAVRMINLREIRTIFRISKYEAGVLVATLLLTVLTDLVFAVQVGMMLAVFLLFIRFSSLMEIKPIEEYDPTHELSLLLKENPKLRDNVSIYTLHGPFFFGAMTLFDTKLEEHMHIKKKYIILRMKHVPYIDASAVIRLVDFIKSRNKKGYKVFLAHLQDGVRETLFANPEFQELIVDNNLFDTTDEAIDYILKKYLK